MGWNDPDWGEKIHWVFEHLDDPKIPDQKVGAPGESLKDLATLKPEDLNEKTGAPLICFLRRCRLEVQAKVYRTINAESSQDAPNGSFELGFRDYHLPLPYILTAQADVNHRLVTWGSDMRLHLDTQSNPRVDRAPRA